jgi:hypothetical protein
MNPYVYNCIIKPLNIALCNITYCSTVLYSGSRYACVRIRRHSQYVLNKRKDANCSAHKVT